MHLPSLLPIIIASTAAAQIVATVFSQPNFGGQSKHIVGYGCSNTGSEGFEIQSIKLSKHTFCYLYWATGHPGHVPVTRSGILTARKPGFGHLVSGLRHLPDPDGR
ncbi:Cyanate hydratase [Tolypocladium capitatum]|uniref:Cyanate hydratase n=1 Tax=Tolypocladium capitatum TaxID=45235 RepID=A0A2K3Q6I6_9HYPO|nr:Cyanate hydratase [Tolypocladium capitatum]